VPQRGGNGTEPQIRSIARRRRKELLARSARSSEPFFSLTEYSPVNSRIDFHANKLHRISRTISLMFALRSLASWLN
jgi:hypothetical protein